MAQVPLRFPCRLAWQCLLALAVWAAPLCAQTFLIDVASGSSLNDKVSGARFGRYELSDGTPAPVDTWYGSSWRDLRFEWMNQISPDLGLLWGFSTGEAGPKYRIGPGFELGFLWQTPVSRRASISLRASARAGGRLTEQSCIADYGEIGGIQEVNCRMAASILPPEETLAYLWDESPADLLRVEFRWVFRF